MADKETIKKCNLAIFSNFVPSYYIQLDFILAGFKMTDLKIIKKCSNFEKSEMCCLLVNVFHAIKLLVSMNNFSINMETALNYRLDIIWIGGCWSIGFFSTAWSSFIHKLHVTVDGDATFVYSGS